MLNGNDCGDDPPAAVSRNLRHVWLVLVDSFRCLCTRERRSNIRGPACQWQVLHSPSPTSRPPRYTSNSRDKPGRERMAGADATRTIFQGRAGFFLYKKKRWCLVSHSVQLALLFVGYLYESWCHGMLSPLEANMKPGPSNVFLLFSCVPLVHPSSRMDAVPLVVIPGYCRDVPPSMQVRGPAGVHQGAPGGQGGVYIG